MIPFEPLPDYNVIGMDTTAATAVVCLERREHPNECTHCRSTQLQRFGRRPQHVADLPAAPDLQVMLSITTQRFRCLSCQKTFYENLPGISPNHAMTKRLIAWIGPEAERRHFTAIARDVGIAETTVRKVFQEYLNNRRAMRRAQLPFSTLTVANVSVIRPACAIADGDRGRLLELLPNQRQASLTDALLRLAGHETITAVCIEPIEIHRNAVRDALPAARLTIDPRSVHRMIASVMAKVFEQAIERIPPDIRTMKPLEEKVLMKPASELTDGEEEALYEWSRRFPAINEAYRAREHLTEVLRQSARQHSLEYSHWWQGIVGQMRSLFRPVNHFLDTWVEEFIAGTELQLMTPVDLATNTEASSTRLGRQYSFRVVRELLLLSGQQ